MRRDISEGKIVRMEVTTILIVIGEKANEKYKFPFMFKGRQ